MKEAGDKKVGPDGKGLGGPSEDPGITLREQGAVRGGKQEQPDLIYSMGPCLNFVLKKRKKKRPQKEQSRCRESHGFTTGVFSKLIFLLGGKRTVLFADCSGVCTSDVMTMHLSKHRTLHAHT